MEEEQPPTSELEALLGRMRLPSIPDDAFDKDNADLAQIRSWRKLYVASILSGLLTEPHLHANGIRLDWLQRLVLSKSEGRRKPNSAALSRALNAGLENAGVLRLEDPNEDRFCETLTTAEGTYLIFPGQWEGAGPYTETLIRAFHSLPDGGLKDDTLKAIYSLLRLSDALAARASVKAFTPSQREPKGLVKLMDTAALERLARRVKFTDAELESLRIDKKALGPFFLKPQHYKLVSDRPIGDTPLEFYSLVNLQAGISVISPVNISLAARSALIQAALSGGMQTSLLYELMRVQERYSESSAFGLLLAFNCRRRTYTTCEPQCVNLLEAAICTSSNCRSPSTVFHVKRSRRRVR